MFISNIGIESLLGGGVGLALVLGSASSVLVEVFEATGPISEENLASRVRVPYKFTTKHKLLLDIG